MGPDHGLFRPEALQSAGHSWLGEIVLSRPHSIRRIACVVALGSAALLAFATFGTYTRKVHAIGYLVPAAGVAKIVALQSGVIIDQPVTEGTRVLSGATLAVIGTERQSSDGNTHAKIIEQLSLRKARLRAEGVRTNRMYDEQTKVLDEREGLAQEEIARLNAAIELQSERVTNAQQVEAKYKELQERGQFFSDLSIRQRRQETLAEQATLEQLRRSLAASRKDLAALRLDKANLPFKRENDISYIDRALAELEQETAENTARKGTVVSAARGGIVTAIASEVGKPVLAGQPLMTLLPEDGPLEASLYVTSQAIGFVREGSRTMLQYAAYPYQKFGNYEGTVSRVSQSSVPASDLPFPAPAGDVYFVVNVRLDSQAVQAHGATHSLRSGMVLEGIVLVETRRLIEWAFEPLLSITGRWAT